MYPVKSCIAPAIHLFINRYSQVTAHHMAMIYLYRKLSVKIHKESGETLTHSVVHFLPSLIPPRFDCIDSHQNIFGPSLRLPCRLNQSVHIWDCADILLLWHSGSSMLVHCSISHSTSSMQSPSLSNGLSKSPFQLSPSSVSEMLSHARFSSVSSGSRLFHRIWRTVRARTQVLGSIGIWYGTRLHMDMSEIKCNSKW